MLAYIIRKIGASDPIGIQQDTGATQDSPTMIRYNGDIMSKLIHYMPHIGSEHIKDNAKVLQLLHDPVHVTVYASYITHFI